LRRGAQAANSEAASQPVAVTPQVPTNGAS
jgi:hypothetical protein